MNHPPPGRRALAPAPLLALVVAVVLALSGCYQVRPYEAKAVLDELRRADPAAAAASPPTVAAPPAQAIDAEEAVALALQQNPDLRALRHTRGVAEGQITAARALANPTLDLQLLHIQTLPASPAAYSVELGWEPPQPGLFAARSDAARANLEAVKAEIGERELQLAFEVRVAHAQLVSLGEQRALVEQGIEVRRRVRELVERRVGGGASTRIDLGLAELALADVERDRDEVAARRIDAGRRLAELLGTTRAPEVRGALRDGAERVPELAALEEQAVSARPLLAAEEARCAQREHQIRLEQARRWPWFRFSAAPRYRTNDTAQFPTDFALGVQLVLPLFDQNAGPIRVAELVSEQQREQLRKQVATVRRELAAARDEIELRRGVLERYRQSVLPGIERQEKLLQSAGSGGQLDLVAVLSAQAAILRGRREFADLRLAAHRAWLALERAAGQPIPRADVNAGHAALDR